MKKRPVPLISLFMSALIGLSACALKEGEIRRTSYHLDAANKYVVAHVPCINFSGLCLNNEGNFIIAGTLANTNFGVKVLIDPNDLHHALLVYDPPEGDNTHQECWEDIVKEYTQPVEGRNGKGEQMHAEVDETCIGITGSPSAEYIPLPSGAKK